MTKTSLVRTVAFWCGLAAAGWMSPGGAVEAPRPPLAPIPAECAAPGVDMSGTSNMSSVVQALRERNKIVVLAIGAYGSGRRGAGDYYSLVESFLERVFKGLDVVIVERGISGELARDAAVRIRLETARTAPDIVFWQVGTVDAMAGIPPDELAETVRDTIRWLKAHNVDTVLIGLHYSRVLADDPEYQAVRTALTDVAKQENVLRIRRYEVDEILSKMHDQANGTLSDTELTTAGYNCMAEYLARAIATGLFAKPATN